MAKYHENANREKAGVAALGLDDFRIRKIFQENVGH